MTWTTLVWRWWVEAALGGLVVLALGSLAAGACRQPVHRARIIVLTVLGCLLAPLLGAQPFAPRWSAGLFPFVGVTMPSDRVEVGSAGVSAIPSLPPRSDLFLGAAPGIAERGPITPDRPVGTRPGSIRLSEPRPSRNFSISWTLIAFLACGAVSAGLATWWLIGQATLLRLAGSARPTTARIRDRFLAISGPAGQRVRLLETDRIALPFTFTWFRPTILVPSDFCTEADSEELIYALGHEWSHIERRDYRDWTLVTLAGLLLFYQPLFWWLRRQLRLCQDYLADDRAAALGSPEAYAAYLVRLARCRVAGPPLPALGIGDRRSNLHRRVVMLVKDREPLEHRCRKHWSVIAAATAVVVIVAASGLRLNAASPIVDKPGAKEANPVQDVAKTPGDAKTPGETLSYKGIVKNKDNGKPIAGSTVVVRRSILRSGENKILQETKHTTAEDGTYAFTIPPEQVAERHLYIELDVEHPDFATRAGFGYALAMTRKNEGLGERPFFETIEMRPASPITGRIETPEGTPAAGIKLLAYSKTDKVAKGYFEYGSFARAKTDADGRFRLPITTPGQGVFWIIPEKHAPEMHVLADGKRGDLGTITLTRGVSLTGVALDVDGKPLANLLIEACRERGKGKGPEFEALDRMGVTDALQRTVETDAEGRFTFDPLPPATYRILPTGYEDWVVRPNSRTRRELPGVFAPKSLTIKDGETVSPIEVRALPHVVIEGQWLDSKGQPKGGWESGVFGRMDGASWFDQARPDPQGKFSLKVPHGLEEVQLDISTNEHASARYRIGKDGPLIEGRTVKLGTLDHDVKGIEIVRYVAPIIVVNATTKVGKQIKGFKATVKYTTVDPNSRAMVSLAGGGEETEAIRDEQNDGRYRTSHLLPGREVEITATAVGFAEASRKLKLAEGTTEEVNFVLEPK
jgi:beta-lactamase regulating signal transducer with metallopeptidase domain